jgi:large subunit ribosomal protein L15
VIKILKPADKAVKKGKRRGRGNASGLGGECGRGHKGQKSRSGGSCRPGFEGGQMPLYRRMPKKRGFFNKFKKEYFIINLDDLDKHFADNDVIEMSALNAKGITSKSCNLKILGRGKLTKKVTIKAHSFSKTALEKIQQIQAKYEIIQ